MGLFNFTTGGSVFGLDIGFEALKLVELKKGKKEVQLVGAIEVPLTERILEKDRFKNKSATANLIKEACRKAKPNQITAQKIISALPETFVFSKTIQIPKMSDEEYINAIPVEAAKYLPIPVEDVYLDFQLLIAHPNEPMADILIVASPKKLVDEYVEVTKMAGFELAALETKPIAVGRGVAVSHTLKGTLIIEIGTEVSRLSIWDNQNIRLITSINVGKNHIAENLSDTSDPISMKANPALQNIVTEIINAIKYHQNRDYKPATIDSILVSGSGAKIAGISEFLSQELKINTEIVLPKLSGKVQLGPEYITSFGLALRNEFD